MEMPQYGNNIVTVRENNLSLIIRLLHQAKICSRADLAKATGLTQATITNIINSLMEWGIVRETGFIPGTGNRRSIGITLNNENYCTIGVRINRNYVKAGLFDISGKALEHRESLVSLRYDPADAMRTICSFAAELCAAAGQRNVLGVGVALPGPFLNKKGRIGLMSGFPGWSEVDISGELKRSLDLPIFIEHDANCGALAEMWYGDIGSCSNVVFVAADIGVGAGILINRKLYTGNLGIAGEIGHISLDYSGPRCECGSRGCLERYCSTEVLVQEYKKELFLEKKEHDTQITSERILLDVANGDELARRAFLRVASFLGIGLVSVVNAFDPDLIILSDQMALAGEYLVTVIDQVLSERLLPQVYEGLTVRLSAFSKDSMLLGASGLVFDHLISQPSVYFKPKE